MMKPAVGPKMSKLPPQSKHYTRLQKKKRNVSGPKKIGALISLLTLAACGGTSTVLPEQASSGAGSAAPTPESNTGAQPSTNTLDYKVLAEDVASVMPSNASSWSEGGLSISTESAWAQFLKDNGLSSADSIDFRLHDVLVYRKLTSNSCGRVAFQELRHALAQELSNGEPAKLVLTAAVDTDGASVNANTNAEVSCLTGMQAKNILVKVNKLNIPVEYREIGLTY